MSMREAILTLPRQFSYEPAIENAAALPKRRRKFALCGMGGSALAADLLLAWDPAIDLIVHRGYGLPNARDLGTRFAIVSSYSGNTEETLDAYAALRTRGIAVAVIATGGALFEQARHDRVPFVALPKTGIQPRAAVGYSILALSALLRNVRAMRSLHTLERTLDVEACDTAGRALAEAFADRTPIVYASDRNAALARHWKIAINETGKNPAFMNTLPELNHNEMTGFDVGPDARALLDRFTIILLEDAEDDPRVQRRMDTLGALLEERGIPTHAAPLTGDERFQRIFGSVALASATAYHLALRDRAEPEQVPMVEEFKRRMASKGLSDAL